MQDTTCTVIDETRMSCITVPLVPAGVLRRQADNTTQNVSYTVVVDNAPGPDLSNLLLQLNVLPDPVIGDLDDTVASAVMNITVSSILIHYIQGLLYTMPFLLFMYPYEFRELI